MKIGFIGLGNVGGKLAGSLQRNGFNLAVRDLDRTVAETFPEERSRLGGYAAGTGRGLQCGDHLPAVAGRLGGGDASR